MGLIRRTLSLLPRPLREALLVVYHLSLACFGALWYSFPSKKLIVVGVTGTKGKSTTTELIRVILSHAGHTTAAAGTIRFSIGEEEEPNLFKMTMPGRFFLQRFLRKAVAKGATHAVIEMTSEGAKQMRHRGISLNALVVTNLSPEHIESHGSFEKYKQAKLSLARHLSRSSKRPRILVVNGDDLHADAFLAHSAEEKVSYHFTDVVMSPESPARNDFTYKGIPVPFLLPGRFNIMNALAALRITEALGIDTRTAAEALGKVERVAGRAERIEKGQPFTVVVDYAHTPDSLEAIYTAFKPNNGGKLICVLGNTGGGRDTWKRSVMGSIADRYCDVAILTDEDPYDEDPRAIVEAVAAGFSTHVPHIEMDRRQAIAHAIAVANPDDAVLITGKGTDPYIMRAEGTKEAWSDRKVAEEELAKRHATK